jgi:hypothetical protein
MPVIMVKVNKVNNVNHRYYDEQNNERLYLDHVFVINVNLNSYMVNVVEMIERESQAMVSEYPLNKDNYIYRYFEGKKTFIYINS